jgi:hypothetical protein
VNILYRLLRINWFSSMSVWSSRTCIMINESLSGFEEKYLFKISMVNPVIIDNNVFKSYHSRFSRGYVLNSLFTWHTIWTDLFLNFIIIRPLYTKKKEITLKKVWVRNYLLAQHHDEGNWVKESYRMIKEYMR